MNDNYRPQGQPPNYQYNDTNPGNQGENLWGEDPWGQGTADGSYGNPAPYSNPPMQNWSRDSGQFTNPNAGYYPAAAPQGQSVYEPPRRGGGSTVAIVLSTIAVVLVLVLVGWFFFNQQSVRDNNSASSSHSGSASNEQQSTSSSRGGNPTSGAPAPEPEDSGGRPTTAHLPAGVSPVNDAASSGAPVGDLNAVWLSGPTSAGFALSVRDAYIDEYLAGDQDDFNHSVVVYSHATGRYYNMRCVDRGSYIHCTGGNNANVYIA